MTQEELNRPLFSLTVGEFLELQKQSEPTIVVDVSNERKYVYGIAGLARLFNCHINTAQRIKNSGRIDKAIKQCGRKIAIDAELALALNEVGR
jgi:hypothetical protein